MMITFKSSSSQLTDTAQVVHDKVARALQSEQLAKRPVQIPLQGEVSIFGDRLTLGTITMSPGMEAPVIYDDLCVSWVRRRAGGDRDLDRRRT